MQCLYTPESISISFGESSSGPPPEQYYEQDIESHCGLTLIHRKPPITNTSSWNRHHSPKFKHLGFINNTRIRGAALPVPDIRYGLIPQNGQ